MMKPAGMARPGIALAVLVTAFALSGPAHAAPAATQDLTAAAIMAHPATAQHPIIVQQATAQQDIAPQDAVPAAPAPIWSDASGTWEQTGVASWYGGKRWQGRRTASGVRYDENKLTAAHATLPLGTRVRVLVPATGRSVVVTINDRPGTRTRIIDLSRAAARRLGIVSRGIATVTLLPG